MSSIDLTNLVDTSDKSDAEIKLLQSYLDQHGEIVLKTTLEYEQNAEYLCQYLDDYTLFDDPSLAANKKAFIRQNAAKSGVTLDERFIQTYAEKTFDQMSAYHTETAIIGTAVIAYWGMSKWG